ncbi:hypothetical protein DJ71_28540 [Halorubrum sp. E3]|nr:hypothetical protein DJ71_28540 [Halorubrum sp. E3]
MGRDYTLFIVVVGAGAATTHVFVPPTPGPLAVADRIGSNLGMTILVGLAVAIPAAIVSWARLRALDQQPAGHPAARHDGDLDGGASGGRGPPDQRASGHAGVAGADPAGRPADRVVDVRQHVPGSGSGARLAPAGHRLPRQQERRADDRRARGRVHVLPLRRDDPERVERRAHRGAEKRREHRRDHGGRWLLRRAARRAPDEG